MTHGALRQALAAVASVAIGFSAAAAEVSSEDTAALLRPVSAWVDAFNRWEAAYPRDAFTDDATVIDQFPPYVWAGGGAPRAWWTALMGASPEIHERRRVLAQHVEMQAPTFVQVNGDSAYFVMASLLTWTVKGERHEMTASWIATEARGPDGWRITSHSWAPLSETVRKAP